MNIEITMRVDGKLFAIRQAELDKIQFIWLVQALAFAFKEKQHLTDTDIEAMDAFGQTTKE